MPVDRCICHDVPFADLKVLAEQLGSCAHTEKELRRRTGCGTACGLCVPYVRLMLRTGQTTFPVLAPGEWRRILDEGPDTRGA